MIVGANPRKEAPVLNARIRKRWRAGKFPIALIGERADLTYDYNYLGAGPETLGSLKGDELGKAERPLWLIGQGALARPDGAAVLALAAKAAHAAGAIKDGWNGFSILHTAAARVGALDIGFVPAAGGLSATQMAQAGALDVVFLLGADEIDIAPGAFVVYIGTHGDRGAHRADVILPGAAYTEKSGIYVNTEGRVQMAARAGFPPGDAREDWAILRALSDLLGQKLPYDSLVGAARRAVCRLPASRAGRPDRGRRSGRYHQPGGARRHARQGAVPLADHRLLSHQPDRPRLRDHGRMLRAGARPAGADGGGVARWPNSGRAISGR